MLSKNIYSGLLYVFSSILASYYSILRKSIVKFYSGTVPQLGWRVRSTEMKSSGFSIEIIMGRWFGAKLSIGL